MVPWSSSLQSSSQSFLAFMCSSLSGAGFHSLLKQPASRLYLAALNAALQSTLHNHQGVLSKTHFCSCPSLVKSLPPHCPQKNVHVVNKACKPFLILSDLPTLPQSNLLSNYLQWLGFPESTKLFLYIPTLYLLCPLPGELLFILRDPMPISPAL